MLSTLLFSPLHQLYFLFLQRLEQLPSRFSRARLYRVFLVFLLRFTEALGAESPPEEPPSPAASTSELVPASDANKSSETNKASDASQATFTGKVLEAGTRKPLDDVSITLTSAQGQKLGQTSTNAQGLFTLTQLPTGTHSARFERQGYQLVVTNIQTSPEKQVQFVVYLYEDHSDKGTIDVNFDRESQEVIEHSFSMEEVRSTPGAFGDAIRATQNLPGMARAPFGLGLLIVRGSGPNDTGTFFNGLQVPIIFHFGGLISVYSSSILDRISYLPGGYSARYGRNLGGVIDVTTRTDIPEQTHGYADINLMDSSFFVETRLGNSGLSLSARRSYIDVLANPLLENTNGFQIQLPRYWDLQLKADTMLGSYDALQLSVTASDDRFAILGNASEAQNENEAPSLSTYTTTWRARGSWTHFFKGSASHRLDVAVGPDAQNAEFGVGEIRREPFRFDVRSELQAVVTPELNLKAGLDFQSSYYVFDLNLTGTFDQTDATDGDTTDGDTTATDETSLIHQETWNFSPSPYLEAEWTVGNRLKVIPGLRLDPFWIPDQYAALTFDPRLSARFELNKQALIKGSIGQYSQFGELNQLLEETGTPELTPSHSLQSTLGFEYDFTPRLHLDVVGYYNAMSDLVVSNSARFGLLTGQSQGSSPDDDSSGEEASEEPLYTNEGLGRSYGLEVLFRQETGGKFYGWLSYSLSRSERKTVEEEDWHLYNFDQTHVLTLVGAYRLPREWEVSARYRYASGNPYTPIVNSYQDLDSDSWVGISGETNSARNDYFSQLDVRVQKDWVFNTWKLQWYLDIQNITNRANPEITVPNFDYRDSTVITSLPFLPVAGLRGSF